MVKKERKFADKFYKIDISEMCVIVKAKTQQQADKIFENYIYPEGCFNNKDIRCTSMGWEIGRVKEDNPDYHTVSQFCDPSTSLQNILLEKWRKQDE